MKTQAAEETRNSPTDSFWGARLLTKGVDRSNELYRLSRFSAQAYKHICFLADTERSPKIRQFLLDTSNDYYLSNMINRSGDVY